MVDLAKVQHEILWWGQTHSLSGCHGLRAISLMPTKAMAEKYAERLAHHMPRYTYTVRKAL